jgi:hypothetical protein
MSKLFTCPKCASELEIDPDGGWCSDCQIYWDNADLQEEDQGWD